MNYDQLVFAMSERKGKPNDPYMGRTAPLTSRRCILYIQQILYILYICIIYTLYILYIYSTNIHTEYFKHAAHSPLIFLFKVPFIS